MIPFRLDSWDCHFVMIGTCMASILSVEVSEFRCAPFNASLTSILTARSVPSRSAVDLREEV